MPLSKFRHSFLWKEIATSQFISKLNMLLMNQTISVPTSWSSPKATGRHQILEMPPISSSVLYQLHVIHQIPAPVALTQQQMTSAHSLADTGQSHLRLQRAIIPASAIWGTRADFVLAVKKDFTNLEDYASNAKKAT